MASLLTEHQQRGILPGDPANYGALQVAFSPDGKRLAVAYGDGYVRMWDPVTGQAAGSPLAADTDPNANGACTGWRSAGRQSAGYRRHGRVCAAVGSGHPAGRRRAPPGRCRPGGERVRRGVQPGRQVPGHRRHGRHRAAVASADFRRSVRRTLRRCWTASKGRLDALRPGRTAAQRVPMTHVPLPASPGPNAAPADFQIVSSWSRMVRIHTWCMDRERPAETARRTSSCRSSG